MMGHLEALAEIALALSLLMTIAWLVQQRTGNSGWVDTIWTFSVGMTGAVADRRPLPEPPATAITGVGRPVGAGTVSLSRSVAAPPIMCTVSATPHLPSR